MVRIERGFIIVFVLLLLAVATAAVIGTLGVVKSERAGSVRDNERVNAKAVAQRCLQTATTYLTQLRDQTRPADFDAVLDPALNSHPAANGGAADHSDDFVPGASFGGTVVYLPSGESGSTGLRQAMHRYRYVDVVIDPAPGKPRGGCLVRFDDNNDDSDPVALGGVDNAVPTIEGPADAGMGVNIPYRDRDMGVFVTAIGVYPVSPATAPADAYHKAHARSTLKAFVGVGGAPALVAEGDLVVSANVAVCGLGGFQGDDLAYAGGGTALNVCSCGDIATNTGAAPPNTCNYAVAPGNQCAATPPCQPGSTTDLAAAPVVDVKVPTPASWLQLDGFHESGNVQSLGTNGVCEFYFRSKNVERNWTADPATGAITETANDVSALFMGWAGHVDTGEIFVWDHTDDDAVGCTDATDRDRRADDASCPVGQRIRHNCQSFDMVAAGTATVINGKTVVKRPCEWRNGNALQGPVVYCDDALDVTPCWKLVAKVREAGGVITDVVHQEAALLAVGVNPAPPAASADTREDVNGPPTAGLIREVFQPKMAERVPNIEKFWGETPPGTGDGDPAVLPGGESWADLCGPCPNCGTVDGWGMKGDEHFHFEEDPMCSNDFFSPSILAFENMPHALTVNDDDARMHVRQRWGDVGACGGTPVKVTVLAQAHVDFDLNTQVACPWCDVTGFPASPNPCNATLQSKAKGFAIRAGGSCYMNNGAIVVGHIQCGNVHVKEAAECIAGDLISWYDASAKPMGNECSFGEGGFPTCTAGLCLKESVKVVGNLYSDGDICIKEGATIFGSVLAGGDGTGNVFIKDNTVINGQIVSEGDIGLKNNVAINNAGGGIYGSRVESANPFEGGY